VKKVFVSSCYDMLHSGHVAFFEEAASHGDLYVGIGSDKTVYEIKDRKPFNNEQERLYMVKSLKYVKDAWINSGSGFIDFLLELRELRPDIFFVNSDGHSNLEEQLCSAGRPLAGVVVPTTPTPSMSAIPIRRTYWPCRAVLWLP
jgi:cytidyltransferase-like protein